MEDRPHKAHRPAHSGGKAEKKDKGKGKEKQHSFNEKAFAPKSGRNADRQGRRNVERDQTRLHVPLVNRTPDDLPPPILVAIVGPPGVGKTTLLKSLVRRYTKQTLNDAKGPITVVSGKKRRITFVECNNDLNSMIDIGKIADLVLLMIDGSFGFEMETFEFLNILQSHGFPKVIGILTHLDLIKKAAILRASKKALKKRFWTEIYQGAKLFYLSGVLNGRYPDTEILNLSRFISVMKFRPLVFRNTHPYLIADRIEDLTPRELIRTSNRKCDRTVTVYGYVRGTNLRPGQRVHIPGVGDLDMKSVTILGDPCPLPDADSEKRRKLSEKKKLLVHAPMSDVGGVVYDKDAVFTRRTEGEEGVLQGEGERMVMDLQEAGMTLDDAVKQTHIKLFGSSEKHLAVGIDEDEDMDEDMEDDEDEDAEDEEDLDSDADVDDDDEHAHSLSMNQLRSNPRNTGRSQPRHPARTLPSRSSSGKHQKSEVDFAESDSDLGDEDEGDFMGGGGRRTRFGFGDDDMDMDFHDDEDGEGEFDNDKDEQEEGGHNNKALDALAGKRRRRDWMKDIYSSSLTPEEILSSNPSSSSSSKPTTDFDDDFFSIKKSSLFHEGTNTLEFADKTKTSPDLAELSKWEDEEMLDSVRKLFITADLNVAAEGGEGEGGDGEWNGTGNDDDDDDGEGGDFVDFEAMGGGDPSASTADPVTAVPSSSFATGPSSDPSSSRSAIAVKKAALKARFDEEYDDPDASKGVDFYDEKKAEMALQLQLNKAEFAKIADPEARALVEGYVPGTYVRIELTSVAAELIEHFDARYPIVIGGLLPAEERMGYVQVRLKRHRWFTKTLKTNDPLILSIGWRRFQTMPIYSLDDHSIRMRMLKYTPEHMHCYATFWGPVALPNTGFLSATGVVLSIDSSVQIVKKLKLTGTPYKVFKNTAFIKGMFSSALEVAKFEGANVRTVSGILFRAAFEDKVLMSDIPRKFYFPVTSLLLPSQSQSVSESTSPDTETKSNWQGMRLTGQVRRDLGIKTPLNINSTYKKIQRPEKKFNPLVVPKKLQAALPYKSKPKLMAKQGGGEKVVLEPEEKKAVALLQQIRALRKDQVAKRREKKEEKKEKRAKELEKEAERKGEKEKEKRKEYMKVAGQKSKREADMQEGRSAKRRKTS
ncbi:DUF663-domain-containing protein [Gymnopus androsaceus JB14]|uniref:DUF663-domain-containing protein n=1 Tax=Gymnopus androsaceus JB14 TaxID=1447944 RepID=A0A6A4IAK5_9AGAR|nr:DUF663-domain-containing protein [Gymnopus androsaceus JB14]